jgi:hypothetical protein
MKRFGQGARFAAFGVAVTVVAGMTSHPAVAAQPTGVVASLIVEIAAEEGAISVSESFQLSGGVTGSWVVPLLLPETGPQPPLVARVGDAPGLEVRGQGGASVRVRDGEVVVTGSPGMSGDFTVQVHYQVAVKDERVVLSTKPQVALARVQVVHRGGPYALQLRPLAAFAYSEESEGDGTWRTQELMEPVPVGGGLRIAVGRLPTATGPYRSAGLAVLLVVAAGAIVMGIRRRNG